MKTSPVHTVAFFLTVLSLFVWCSCGSGTEKESALKQPGASSATNRLANGDSVVIVLTGADSQTVLDLLQKEHRVEHTSSVMGVFVTAIDAIENGGGAYWIYSVNDSVPQVACDKYVTKSGDVVRWHFRKTGR